MTKLHDSGFPRDTLNGQNVSVVLFNDGGVIFLAARRDSAVAKILGVRYKKYHSHLSVLSIDDSLQYQKRAIRNYLWKKEKASME
ncbi:hypothetical protein TNCT_144831 [Trichonephila clavata]|uniref:Uncharacterized protein n=1 Tax=Trichonephila clavata TaxID=2740835 RepID=A0A8X6JK72_TRICU|nr:hypothetical protein TNCT_144831 [Trichonephila clavata]